MGYCCYCIPFKLYAWILALILIVFGVYHYIIIGLFSDPKKDLIAILIFLQLVIYIIYVVAAAYLIGGLMTLRHKYIKAYLILILINIFALLVALILSFFLTRDTVKWTLPLYLFFLVQAFLLFLLSFPIYLLYKELYESAECPPPSCCATETKTIYVGSSDGC